MAKDCGRGGDSRNAMSRRGRTGTAMAATRVRGGRGGIEASAVTLGYGAAAAAAAALGHGL